MRYWILSILLPLLSACGALTPEQAAELSKLRTENLAAIEKGKSLTIELDQARDDFKSGRLTQEKLTDLTLKSNEAMELARKTFEANAAKIAELEKQGVSPFRSIWEGGGRELAIGLAGAWIWKNQKDGDKKAQAEAVGKVMELRGPPRPKAQVG